ncbi:MAG: phage tail protein, partial [Pseudaminobacter sp.]
LEQTVGTLSGKVEAQEAQPKIALSIAASALKSAVDRGAPFEAELETFAAIVPDAPEIQSLRAYAGQGVVSRNDLLGESDAAVKAMIAAAKPVAEDAGFFDRLLNSAESLVSVRPIGAVEGAGVPETAARMEFAVKAGNLEQALAEYDSLPEPAKAAGSAFAEKIRARVEAERLVDQVVAGAMKA